MIEDSYKRLEWEQDSRLASEMERVWFGFFSNHGRLTTVQRAAIPVILEGKDVLICAATASGKTEAACAPLVERLLRRGRQGIILYITPTRALVNDLYYRLEAPLRSLNLQIRRRTGEYNSGQTSTSPSVLITTPESLDSMLSRGSFHKEDMNGHILAKVEAVVLDEIHLLYGSSRGEQVKWLLERLRRLRIEAVRKGWHRNSDIQVIGLSATVADPDSVVEEFIPHGTIIQIDGSRLIEVCNPEVDNYQFNTSTSYAPLKEHLISYISQLKKQEKILVFSSSRKRVDELAAYFRTRLDAFGYRVTAHHSSLEKLPREEVEELVKSQKKIVLFSTSTLEIGVDIGDIDIVFLDGPPPDVSSFLQRIGRGNRRSGVTRVFLCAETAADQLIQMGMLSAAKVGQMLSKPPGKHYAVIRQQIASYLFQSPKLRRGHTQLTGLFTHIIDHSKLSILLNEMVRNEELLESEEGYRLGEYWIEQSKSGTIHSNIESAGGYKVIDERTGVGIAKGVVLRGGKQLSIGGKHMHVKRQSNYTIEVKQNVKEMYGIEGYGYASGQKMRNDSRALAVRELLKIPEKVWPVLKFSDGNRYIFHLGGPRRAAYLRLLHDLVFPGQPLKLTEFWYCCERMDESFLREQKITVYQLQEMASARIDWLEQLLGRPIMNKKLPKVLRVDELLSWIRIDDENEMARNVTFRQDFNAPILSLFVDK